MRQRPPHALPDAVLTTAIHAGHHLRAEIAERIRLSEEARLREEDPFTDRIAAIGTPSVAVRRSRFEVDLNRPREGAIYHSPDMAWGLDVWRKPLPPDVVERSLALYDGFYEQLARHLDRVAQQRRTFLVLDVHSYNHRRQGADAPPSPPEANPEVNIGTGTLDRERWAEVVERFTASLSGQVVRGHALDVRENVRFEGGHLSRWVNERYSGHGCALALEFKKGFMDEWTGRVDGDHLEELRRALRVTTRGIVVGAVP
jgi:N-formylglutamate deformylase